MKEKEKGKEGAVKRDPVRFNNVVMVDVRSGLQLKGVFIRPEIWGRNEEYFFSDTPNFYIITAEETTGGCRMDAFISLEKLTRVIIGEELIIESIKKVMR